MMRYKQKVANDLEIVLNKFDSLVSNLEKNFYNNKRESLMKHLDNMKNDIQQIADMVDREDQDMRYGV